MTISITINGEDRTRFVEQRTFSIENILTRQVDRCRLSIKKISGSSTLNYKPKIGNEVIITGGGTKIFGGLIISVSQSLNSVGVLVFDIACEDYTRILDRKLVADTYENMTIDAIIASINSVYLSGEGITLNNVNCPKLISFMGFNYLPVSKCLTLLADYVNYDWYIDYDRDIHFFAKDSSTAPFDIQDNDASYLTNSLLIKSDNTQLRNTIYVRGGEYLANTFTTEIECDGTRNIFDIAYKYKNLSVTTSSESVPNPLSIGLDNIDNPEDYDVLWNFQEKIIKFRDIDLPSSGNVLRIGGQPYLPVRVKIRNTDSIDAMVSAEGGNGEYEYLIIDKTIETREAARERGSAELESYKDTLQEGKFQTYTDGLVAGQRIRINSTAHDIDEYYIINRVTTKLRTHNTFIYTVSVVTTKTFGIIEYLQRVLLDETKKIEINAGEVIDVVEAVDETITVSDVITISTEHNPQSETVTIADSIIEQALDYDVDFVLGPFDTPTGDDRCFIISGGNGGSIMK